MAHASFLDIIQAGLLALFFLAQFSYFEDAWQTESVSPNVMTIYGNLSRILHAMSLLLYGGSFFMVEAYHTHGTAEYWSWTLATLFKAAACLGKDFIETRGFVSLNLAVLHLAVSQRYWHWQPTADW